MADNDTKSLELEDFIQDFMFNSDGDFVDTELFHLTDMGNGHYSIGFRILGKSDDTEES